MSAFDPANAQQAAYWNGDAGHRWTAQQEEQDRLLSPFTAALFEAAAAKLGEKVIDVGCGAGDTTLRAAEITGHALGVDMSEPMLARARERAAAMGSPARFTLADATLHDFSPERADLMISRFGVMFFADPVRAFANLRRGLKAGGRIAFVCWRDLALNPWQNVPYAAALKHLPPPAPPGPDEPGPFAFSEAARVRGVLEGAGFDEIQLTTYEGVLDIADGGGVESAVGKSLSIGATSRALAHQPDEVRAAVVESLRETLASHAQGERVPLGGTVWIVQARA